jgi:hypothetical protein
LTALVPVQAFGLSDELLDMRGQVLTAYRIPLIPNLGTGAGSGDAPRRKQAAQSLGPAGRAERDTLFGSKYL